MFQRNTIEGAGEEFAVCIDSEKPMSSKPDRGNVFRLDKSGNIDAELLSKELTDALAFDIGYRQKDNMKKRAVKTAPDYEAFRNMVACAGLKKVRWAKVIVIHTLLLF